MKKPARRGASWGNMSIPVAWVIKALFVAGAILGPSATLLWVTSARFQSIDDTLVAQGKMIDALAGTVWHRGSDERSSKP